MESNLNHLALFHAVAEAGGISRAAERLMVSQPAVSKQVKESERSVGARLVERHGRGIRLTESGRTLAEYARRIVSLANEARAALTDLEALRRGTLAVGVTPTIGTYLLPDVLVYFRQRFPGVHVEIETAGAGVLAARLAQGALDLALADETLAFPEMERRPFMATPFVAVAAPRHALARRRRVTLASLAAEPLVTRAAEPDGLPIVEQFFAAAGLPIRPALTLGSTEAVKRAAEAGLGVGIVPKLSVEREATAGRLRILRVPDLALSRTLYEVRVGARRPSKAAQAFHCILEHAVRGTLPRRARRRGTRVAQSVE